MSRSYKKTPYSGDHKGKSKKRIANHKIRQKLKDPEFECQHMSYKNAGVNRWDICDFYWVESWKERWKMEQRFHQDYLNNIHGYSSYYKDKPNKKEVYRDWYKHYKMK